MAAWTEHELRRIDDARELQIAPARRNGELRTRTTVWAVGVGDDVYVRAAYGPGIGWHRVARTSHPGRVWAGGVERDVAIEDADRSAWDDEARAARSRRSS